MTGKGIVVYVLRHGEAEPRGPGVKEAARALTPKGRRDVKAVLALAGRVMEAPALIFTSPYERARQTAALALRRFPDARLIETDALLPAASADALWREIGAAGATTVLVAGHEPHLSHFVRFLLEAVVAMDLKKGAIVRIRTAHRVGTPRGELMWMVTPKLARKA